MPRPYALALTLALTLALGCSDSNQPVSIEDASFAAALGVDLAASTKSTGGLYYRDLQVGSGAVVSNGQLVQVHYTGWLTNGTQFDSNQAPQAPYAFHPGAGEVIQGWDFGVLGMHVGGRRQLIIPPALAYGVAGSGPIPGNAILVFTVEVVSAQ